MTTSSPFFGQKNSKKLKFLRFAQNYYYFWCIVFEIFSLREKISKTIDFRRKSKTMRKQGFIHGFRILAFSGQNSYFSLRHEFFRFREKNITYFGVFFLRFAQKIFFCLFEAKKSSSKCIYRCILTHDTPKLVIFLSIFASKNR